jgi:hypothetical protein
VEIHCSRRLLLETDVDRMQAFVTRHQSTVRPASYDIRGELAVQHFGITLIMTRLKTGGKCLSHSRGRGIYNPDSGVNCHD